MAEIFYCHKATPEDYQELDDAEPLEPFEPEPDFDAMWEKHLDNLAWQRTINEPEWAQ